MMATCCIQPIDMVKVRIQLTGELGKGKTIRNPFVVGAKLIREEGILKLYRGLSAALFRQATYTTARMGIFRTVSNALQEEGKSMPFYKRAMAGLCAGGLGSIIGTPADLALVRMQADATLPAARRRNYKHVGDALM